MATEQIRSAVRPAGIVPGLARVFHHLFSLETLLVLFLFAAHLKILLPSPPIPETVFYGVLSIGVGLVVIYRRGIYVRGFPIVIAGLLFTGWMAMSFGWTPAQETARGSLFFILAVNLWALFAATCIVAGSRERVLRLLFMIVLIAALLGIIGTYIQLVHGSFRFYRGAAGDWSDRVYLYWGNIVAIGAAIAIGMLAYVRRNGLVLLLAAAAAGFGFFFVIVSGARGATLGIMLAGFVVFLVNPPRVSNGRLELPKTQLIAFILLAALLGYVGYLLAAGHSTATVSRLLNLFDQADDPLMRQRSNRFDYFAGAWRAWLDAPVFGQGLQGFRVFFCGFEAEGCYPHNAFLQVMADFGAIGLVLFVAMLWAGLRRLGPGALRTDPLRVILLMGCVPVFFTAMVAGDLTLNHRLFFFLGLLAMSPPPPEEPDGSAEID